MLPELFRIPFLDLPVHTYGALYVTGVMIGLFVAYRQALLAGKYHNDVMDFGFWVLIGALLGARILFIIVEADYYFGTNPFTKIPGIGISIPTFLALWKGGFVFYGGVIGGVTALFLYCRKRKIPVAEFADLIAPGLAVGHAIGRVGCVAGGCCYGHASYHLDAAGKVIADAPFAIAYPPGSIAYDSLMGEASGQTLALMQGLGTTLPLFPVPLLEALGNLAIFLVLMLMIPIKRVHGQIVLSYFVLYSILRSLTETFRGDSARGFVVENVLSTSQFISLMVALVALVLIFVLAKSAKSKQPEKFA